MSTYGTMISRIGSELRRGAAISAQAATAIQSAIRHYRWERFTFNTKRVTTNCVAGQARYPLPTDALEIDSVKIEDPDNSRTYVLDEITPRWIDQHQSADDQTQQPRKWAYENGEIWLHPVPDKAYEIEAATLYELGTLSATTMTNSWMTDAEEMIRLHAKVDLLQNVIRGPEAFSEASALEMREMQIRGQLKRAYFRLMESGTLVPSDEYPGVAL